MATSGNPLGLSRRTAGRVMVVIAYVGVTAAFVGAVFGWIFLGELSDANEQGLKLAEQALTAADASLVVADQVVRSVDDALVTLGSTITTVAGSIDATLDVADSTATLAGQLPDTIDRIDKGLGGIQRIAGTIDATLGQLSRIPLAPDYNPDVTLGESIGGLRKDIAPLATTLRTVSGDLSKFASGSGNLKAEFKDLAASVEEVRAAVSGSTAVIAEARSTTADALAVSKSTLNRIGTQLAFTRLLLVIMAVAIAVGQIVPYWVGRDLLASAD